jgi:hypothetical protein
MFGHELGRIAAAATFARFFGADPDALSPQQVFAAADALWHAYHDWGEVTVVKAESATAVIQVTVPPTAMAPIALTPAGAWPHAAGLFEEVARVTGAISADSTFSLIPSGIQIAVVWDMPA